MSTPKKRALTRKLPPSSLGMMSKITFLNLNINTGLKLAQKKYSYILRTALPFSDSALKCDLGHTDKCFQLSLKLIQKEILCDIVVTEGRMLVVHASICRHAGFNRESKQKCVYGGPTVLWAGPLSPAGLLSHGVGQQCRSVSAACSSSLYCLVPSSRLSD